MEIRHLTEDDAAAYRAVRLRALREDPIGFSESYEEAAAQPVEFTRDRIRAWASSP